MSGRKEGRSDREEGLKKIEREEIVREEEISCCKWIIEREMNASEKEWEEMTTEFKNGTKGRQNLGLVEIIVLHSAADKFRLIAVEI